MRPVSNGIVTPFSSASAIVGGSVRRGGNRSERAGARNYERPTAGRYAHPPWRNWKSFFKHMDEVQAETSLQRLLARGA
jgi:hypothetical protein